MACRPVTNRPAQVTESFCSGQNAKHLAKVTLIDWVSDASLFPVKNAKVFIRMKLKEDPWPCTKYNSDVRDHASRNNEHKIFI